MPLRDHFCPPLDRIRSWDELHGQWPAMIVLALNPRLPPRFVAVPHVHLGTSIEVDVASLEESASVGGEGRPSGEGAGEGGVATAPWAPPRPTFEAATAVPGEDEYEVRVYDTWRQRRLVAAVEFVSPSNKDRPETRRTFVAKCASQLRQQVSVAIVDLVTTRHFNLYGELVELIGQADPWLAGGAPGLYAAACRWAQDREQWRFRAWAHELALGQALPTLPLWLTDDLAVPLDLEATYEQTCRALKIP